MNNKFRECPRCGDRCYQEFNSHTYCASCNYSSDFNLESDYYEEIPDWALRQIHEANFKCKNAEVIDISKVSSRRHEKQKKAI